MQRLSPKSMQSDFSAQRLTPIRWTLSSIYEDLRTDLCFIRELILDESVLTVLNQTLVAVWSDAALRHC